ncbi:MAG: sugar ABC transporter permease [Spirochaetales bacterium]|nr:sugar ABC transporter permease [Spirochaetales bacterium]
MSTRRNLPIALFIAPAVVLVAVFVYVFSGWSAWTSLTDWRIIGRLGTFTGFQNYVQLFREDAIFRQCFYNTLKLMLMVIGITVPLGVVCAVLLDLAVKGRSLFRAIFLIPLSFSFVASATMWSWMFLPDKGSINTLLRMLNLSSLVQPWITSTKQSLVSVAIVYVWQFSGFGTLVYYAGISSVDQDILDAAKVDGARTLQTYTRVVLPLQKPATFTVLLILMMYVLRVFDLVWLLTGGGPAFTSEVLATYMYRVTFNQNLFAYGAAVSFFMFMLSVVIIIVPILIAGYTRKSRRSGAQPT